VSLSLADMREVTKREKAEFDEEKEREVIPASGKDTS